MNTSFKHLTFDAGPDCSGGACFACDCSVGLLFLPTLQRQVTFCCYI